MFIQLLNRRPPFGHEILAAVHQLPQYKLDIIEVDVTSYDGNRAVEVELSVECGLEIHGGSLTKAKKSKSRVSDMTVLLTVNSDLDFIDFRRIP